MAATLRKTGAILSLIMFIGMALYAQAPEKMSYQAVIRDGAGDLVVSQTVGMKISILRGSVGGTAVYVETHTPGTNANGLVTLSVGTGTVVTGAFVSIDWTNGPYFIKIETDPAGGTSYTISGTSELLSVPYALHAKTAATATTATAAGALAFADFYALSPPDNAATVAPGNAVSFPQNSVVSEGIQRVDNNTFLLNDPGIYQVSFQVSVMEAGQLVLNINGVDLAYTVVGRATGTSQIVGMALVETIGFSTLQLRNPAVSFSSLTITPLAGGVNPVSAHLVITKLR
ncbi:hypothetical protein [Dyadobacter frigoris]|uniref:BclA C-terminal domain-containing protein n=1 Tax=Dyadobacter frigoris TaxID=2576211 RepID=A0A4U6CTU5_9BACT|nr:hypothetical protein [Dyadobacter frigoris]TKT87017.1 hypothetical protein FDK13_30860 [Dyadobacter frigoris]GLU52785.1 hypothetical protein Dfri01_22460 [Dyadobacter frigoris]